MTRNLIEETEDKSPASKPTLRACEAGFIIVGERGGAEEWDVMSVVKAAHLEILGTRLERQ